MNIIVIVIIVIVIIVIILILFLIITLMMMMTQRKGGMTPVGHQESEEPENGHQKGLDANVLSDSWEMTFSYTGWIDPKGVTGYHPL
jgi:flagellar basal body-associated protein FliL